MVESACAAGVASSLIFVVLNVIMNLYMKWLFAPTGASFAFPWTMLAVQQAQAFLVLQPLVAYKFPSKRCGWDIGDDDGNGFGWTGALHVLLVTFLFCLNVGLNSLSLVRITITLNQTVRAFLPVGVLALATCLERRTYPKHSYVTTAALIVGIALTCWGSPNFELCGFVLALLSTMVAAVGSSLNGRLLNTGPFSKPGPEKIARLMMLQSLPACFIFSLVAMATEWTELWVALQGMSIPQRSETFLLVSLSSVLALLSNLGRCFLVAATSALMETLAGNAKVATLCIIDHQLFHTSLRAHNYLGIALTFVGFSVHVLLQYASREQHATPIQDERKVGDNHMVISPEGKGELLDTLEEDQPSGMSLPRMISGADTGLAAEHLALRLGKPTPKHGRRCWNRQNEEEWAGNPTSRQRASTWQAGSDPTRTWLDRVGNRMGMDLAPVIEAPPWLTSDESEVFSRIASQEFSNGDSLHSPRDRLGEDGFNPLMLPRDTSRSRIHSDMTHCAVGNPRAIRPTPT
mmetsp:Transcript_81264/g.188773  ORF Transcript_81264/g.188773 Transcript_81264/m.188773 type:complete len:519 (+) Transcript_81264:81-1637(+)